MKTRDINIIGISAQVSDDIAKNCIQAGMKELVANPMSKDKVAELIGKYF